MDEPKRVIIDLDMGTDDYVALLILLYAEKLGQIKLEAIVCTHGNTTTDNVLKNVIRLLEVVNRTDIPVYRGAGKPLLLPVKELSLFHGQDGFADLDHDCEPDISIVRDTPAAVSLHEIISKYPNEVSVICVGPLTTLALAIKLFSDLESAIKDVWIMGGNHSAVGNCTPSAEFNFYSDPEAVHIVFECLKCPITILPWESCLQSTITMKWRFENFVGSAALDLLKKADEKIYDRADLLIENYMPCDAFLCFCFLDPELHIKSQSFHHAVIELHSYHTRGQMVLDHLKKKKPNVVIIKEYDQIRFKNFLLDIKNL